MARHSAEPEQTGRALSRDQMKAYAQFQLSQVASVLAKHGPAGGSLCRCGRPAPCPQQQSLEATRARYEGALALLDQTTVLPIITVAPARRGLRQRLTALAGGVVVEAFEIARLDRYFRHITDRVGPPGTATARGLLVTHLLAERPAFVRAVDRIAGLAAVLPKPKSIDRTALHEVTAAYRVDELTRGLFTDGQRALAFLEERAAGQPVILLDIGGYFAPVLAELCERFTGRILGVVEDTENGHRRYLELGKPPYPVYSVARSPLKQPEDHLVGQSIVFSTEALMRTRGDILPGRAATVIGFGKIGSSIARTLHAKGVRVTVYDDDPIRSTQALSQGFGVAMTRAAAIATAGMVMCATGHLALRRDDFNRLANGAYVASVTSSEDELELHTLDGIYQQTSVSAYG